MESPRYHNNRRTLSLDGDNYDIHPDIVCGGRGEGEEGEFTEEMTKFKIQNPNESKKIQNSNHRLNDLDLNDLFGFWI